MSEVETQSQDERTIAESVEPGSEDEAISLFNQRAKSKAKPSAETPEDEPQDADPLEADKAEPEEEAEADNLIEVEYEGETYKVPPKLKDSLLRQSDYSRRMAEVAELKKDYAQRNESAAKLIEGAEKFAEAKADVKLIEQQIEQFKSVDWDKLEVDDPSRASILAVKLMRLQQAREGAVSKAKAIDAELAEGRSKDFRSRKEEMFKALEKDLQGWGDELGSKITKYALASGYTERDLQQLTDPKLVIALDKARKFDAIQSGKKAAQEKVKDVPAVVKPGAPRRVDLRQDALAKFRKSGSDEDAAEVFKARAAARR